MDESDGWRVSERDLLVTLMCISNYCNNCSMTIVFNEVLLTALLETIFSNVTH